MGDPGRTSPSPGTATARADAADTGLLGLELRDARPAEIDILHRITTDAYREFERVMEPTAWSGLERAIRNAFSRPAPAARRIVAVEGERVVGGVWLFPAGADAYSGAVPPLPWPEVRLLAVDAAARGRGIAKALMEECMRRAAADGASRLGIHTSESMVAARTMYSRMGFNHCPQYDFHPPGGELVEAHVIELAKS